ncbi:MAG TPA: hypothetical protein DEH78_26430 [Solibacterales bacterium]|nr:hypothetical protein [Bryobacterales bacterium]
MKLVRILVPGLILAVGGLVIFSTPTFGKADYTKKEKKACSFCHTNAKPKDGKDLNDAGKHYEKNKSLEGYKK